MELYHQVSYELSRQLTLRYSTSFGMSSRLFGRSVRSDIYAVYGLVRIADEIVDTYEGDNQRQLLDALEQETYSAIRTGYSTNPIIQAFAITAHKNTIDKELIAPFFASMRMDLMPITYTQEQYELYIYGSAEVIGLMCLKVFCRNSNTQYLELKQSARSLGAAYQKINFLRDIAADYAERGRVYFPGVQYEVFSDVDKQTIINDIKDDLAQAKNGLGALPRSAKAAVWLSVLYYKKVLKKLDHSSVEVIKSRRIRISALQKFLLLAYVYFRYKVAA